MSHKGVPGVEVSTGSLGQGMPMAMGMAMAGKLDHEAHSVFCIIGDGECDEGTIWESALIANQFELDNLIVTVDFNKIQSITSVENTIKLEPLDQKWASFGWHVIRIDGHDHAALHRAYAEALARTGQRQPLSWLPTRSGKRQLYGNNVLWHYRTARGEEYDTAVKELERQKREKVHVHPVFAGAGSRNPNLVR